MRARRGGGLAEEGRIHIVGGEALQMVADKDTIKHLALASTFVHQRLAKVSLQLWRDLKCVRMESGMEGSAPHTSSHVEALGYPPSLGVRRTGLGPRSICPLEP